MGRVLGSESRMKTAGTIRKGSRSGEAGAAGPGPGPGPRSPAEGPDGQRSG